MSDLIQGALRVLHVPFGYFPDACGGTEVYVASLCRELAAIGTENVVAAPGEVTGASEQEGMTVYRFAPHSALSQDMMFGGGDPVAAEGFARILDEVRPGLVHFHAYSPAVSVRCLVEAKRRGIPVVTTYHTPTTSCARGTLMRWGTEVCDGEMRTNRCGACFLQGHGMPRLLAGGVSSLSVLASPLSRLPGLSNAARAVLGVNRLMKQRLAAVREWWTQADRVIALCGWTRELLRINGVPDEKIRTVRHGLAAQSEITSEQRPLPASPVRLAFLGRLDPTKGIDLIVHALRLRPELKIELDLYTISQGAANAANAPLIEEIQADARIRICAPVPSTAVVKTLRGYHALLVPSRWLETGPLVVLEAFAAGLPVIGSRLGGIAEWVRHEQDGLLVSEPSVQLWAEALARLCDEPGLVSRLAAGVQTPRSMREVAAEMQAVYAELI